MLKRISINFTYRNNIANNFKLTSVISIMALENKYNNCCNNRNFNGNFTRWIKLLSLQKSLHENIVFLREKDNFRKNLGRKILFFPNNVESVKRVFLELSFRLLPIMVFCFQSSFFSPSFLQTLSLPLPFFSFLVLWYAPHFDCCSLFSHFFYVVWPLQSPLLHYRIYF